MSYRGTVRIEVYPPDLGCPTAQRHLDMLHGAGAKKAKCLECPFDTCREGRNQAEGYLATEIRHKAIIEAWGRLGQDAAAVAKACGVGVRTVWRVVAARNKAA